MYQTPSHIRLNFVLQKRRKKKKLHLIKFVSFYLCFCSLLDYRKAYVLVQVDRSMFEVREIRVLSDEHIDHRWKVRFHHE